MPYLIYAICLIFLIIGLAWMKGEKLFSPVIITAFIWLIVFTYGSSYYDDFYPFIEKNLILWLCWFIVSTILYLLLSPARYINTLTSTRRLSFKYDFLIVILIGALIYKIWEIGTSGPAHFLFNLRLSNIGVDKDLPKLGLLIRIYPLIFALFIFECLNANAQNRKLRVLLWAWMLLFAVASMGKFAVLTPILAWTVIKASKGEFKLGRLFVIGAIAFTLMLAIHFSRASEGDSTNFLDMLAIYVYSPIIALGELDAVGFDSAFAEYSLRFFYAIKYFFAGGTPPVETILDYVHIPSPTNVYTVMQPFYVDFGLIGVIGGALLYGVFFGLLYRFFVQGRQLAILLYAGLSISLVTQSFAETFLLNISGNLQFIIAAATVIFFSKEIKTCQ